MIVLSNALAQTVQPGQAIIFDKIVTESYNRCNCNNTRNVNFATLQRGGTYAITFGGNIGGATAATAVQVAIQVDGVTLPETTMISVPAAAGDLNSVSRTTVLKNCCGDSDRVTVVNNGTTPVDIGANSALTIFKIG